MMASEIVTIDDYYNYISDTILSTEAKSKYSQYSFFNKYESEIDNYIRNFYYKREILSSIVVKNSIEADIQNRVYYCLLGNIYAFNGLYETTQFEYNPLYNVDGTTTITTDLNTSDKNETINTYSYNSEDEKNEKTLTTIDSNGDNTVTDNSHSSKDVSNTAEISDTTYLAQTEISSSGGGSNTVFTDTKTDETEYTTKNKLSNSSDKSENDDRTITTHTVVTEERKGNIGVTKTTDLIQSQRDLLNFNFLDYMCKVLLASFTKGVL